MKNNHSLLYKVQRSMKWISLHLNMLPIIAIEVDQRIQEFQSTALTEKVIIEGDPSDIQQLNTLRSSIKRRIHQLDVFYERHHQDETIPLFHMLRLKLQRTIFKKQHISNETMQLSLSKDKDMFLVEPTAKYNFGEHLSFADYEPLFANQQKKEPTTIKQVRYDNPAPHKQFPIKPVAKKVQKKPSEDTLKKSLKNIGEKATKSTVSVGYEKSTGKSSGSLGYGKLATKTANSSERSIKPKVVQKQKEKVQIMKPIKQEKLKVVQKESSQAKRRKTFQQGMSSSNIVIKEEEEEEKVDSELRFTIKMTKEEYHNLLMIKQQLLTKK